LHKIEKLWVSHYGLYQDIIKEGKVNQSIFRRSLVIPRFPQIEKRKLDLSVKKLEKGTNDEY